VWKLNRDKGEVEREVLRKSIFNEHEAESVLSA